MMRKQLWLLALLFQLPAASASTAEIYPLQLPVHEGLLLLDVAAKGAHRATREEIDISRWFALQHLAQDPSQLDDLNTALIFAAAFVPPLEWHKYMDECQRSLNSCTPEIVGKWQPPYYLKQNGPSVWKGKTPAEFERARAAFVNDYGPALMAEVAELPQDVWIVVDATLSPGAQALQLRSGNFLTPIGRGNDTQRRVPIWNFYSATVTNTLPETVSCAPSTCANLLEAHPDYARISRERALHQQYPAYLLVKLTLEKIDSSQTIRIGPAGFSSGTNESEVQLMGDGQLFYDRELTQPMTTVPL